MFVRSILLLTLLLGACSGVVEEDWPGTGVVRYRGPTERTDGERRAVGEWRFWYPDGTLHAEGDFDGALLPGPDDLREDSTRIPVEGRTRWWSFWDREGRLVAEGQYADGLRERLWTCWYENGRHCCTGRFQAGRAHGYHVTWYPDGSKREERTYVEGRLEGARTVWDDAGETVWKGAYEGGEMVSAEPDGVATPPIHDVDGCAQRGELGHPRAPDLAARGR
jgi:hypothetical protein